MKLASALYGSYHPFDSMMLAENKPMFDDFLCVKKPDQLTTDMALLVHGGADISPSLYRKKVSSYTQAEASFSARDFAEWQLMKEANKLGIPIIGICRGAQMLCALAGGFLVQDVTDHGRSHAVTESGVEQPQSFSVTSCHHQMLYPFDVEHKMIASSTYKLSNHYIDVNEDGKDISIPMPCEPEFVWFPKEKGIAVQWHPEWMAMDTQANKFVEQKIKELCF